jgi:hypothetical protein
MPTRTSILFGIGIVLWMGSTLIANSQAPEPEARNQETPAPRRADSAAVAS